MIRDGQLLWVLRHSDPDDKGSTGVSLAVDSRGAVYATGRSKNRNNDYDFLTIKYEQYGPQQPLKK